jgi:flavin-dependent dehydrogenase
VNVVVIGAGLAGSHLGHLLAEAGVPVTLLDGRSEVEKPCGGGCTPKLAHRLNPSYGLDAPGTLVSTIHYESSLTRPVSLKLSEPIRICSRRDLDSAARARALGSGCRLVPSRAACLERVEGKGWLIRTKDGEALGADFVVGADGVPSLTRRRLGIRFDRADLAVALGYYLPGRCHPDTIRIRFLEPTLSGYLWSFPRTDHLSVGIISAGRRATGAWLRRQLDRFVFEVYGVSDPTSLRGYAASVPALSAATLKRLRAGGPDWALVGDAAGFADPVTAEGIYFAFRSAELLAQVLIDGRPKTYDEAWRDDFGRDLESAARWRDLFYHGGTWCGPLIRPMLRLTELSPSIRRLQDDLIRGRTGYSSLPWRLFRQLPRVVWEVLRRERQPS